MFELRLFATLRKDREKIYELDEREFKSGQKIAEHFNIPLDQISIYLINGIHSKLEDPINPDDVIAIFPPVGGG